MSDELETKVKEKGNVSCFHTFIAEKLKAKAEEEHTNILSRDKVKYVLRTHTIRKEYRQRFIKEMEDYGLIRVKNKRNIEII